MKIIIKATLYIACLLAVPKAALCSCSCWASLGGNYCGGGFRTTTALTLGECKKICSSLFADFPKPAEGDSIAQKCENSPTARNKVIYLQGAQPKFLKKAIECNRMDLLQNASTVTQNLTVPANCAELEAFVNKNK